MTSPSSTLLSPTVAPREVKSDIVLSLKSKGTLAHQLVCCLIDNGCSRGLICETLINPKERLNQRVMKWKTKMAVSSLIGQQSAAFTTHSKVTSIFDIIPATMNKDTYKIITGQNIIANLGFKLISRMEGLYGMN
jgi:hypothetical protein